MTSFFIPFLSPLYVLSLLAGLALVPLGLPGTWLIAAAAFLYAGVAQFNPLYSDWWTLGPVVVMAISAEVVEMGLGVMASKKMDVSNGAVMASLIGGVLGAMMGVPIPLLGSLFGLLLGTFAGAFIYEIALGKEMSVALTSAFATFFSRMTALFVKTLIAFVMVIFLLVKTF